MKKWRKVRKIPYEVKARGPIQSKETHIIEAGNLDADVGDFIVDDGDNTYPVKSDIFYETYKVTIDPKSKKGWFKVKKKPVVVSVRKVESIVYVQTLEGRVKAEPGDYIIKGVENEKYPIKQDKFNENYEFIE